MNTMIITRPCALLLLSLTFLSTAVSGETLALNDDVLGLIVFKSGLKDPFKSLDSWTEDDESPCTWRFVKCHTRNGRVSELSLDNLSLSGKIGCKGLERLVSLNTLTLSNNNLTGEVNPELALIPNLRSLDLSRNALSGNIPPSFSNLSTLQFLDLSMNSLSGSLPDNMFDSYSSLRHLSLAGNRFEGPLPTGLSKCVTLNHLNISGNFFSGNLVSVSGLTRLRTLDLSDNAISGSFPVGISSAHNLKELDLHGNKFSESIPEDIGFCPHLMLIDLSNNLFTGVIPESFQWLTALTSLSLSNNFLTGDFPRWISKLNTLDHLDLSENAFTGSLPISMTDFPNLSMIRLRGNRFNGSIPDGLFNKRLKELDLSRNNLSGIIPSACSKLAETLQVLDLSGNNLRGDIPAELMGLGSKLRYMNLSWNNFETRMPSELGYFQNLSVLDLRNNGLVGSIPGDICDSGSLAILQLDGNSLKGPIPGEIGKCSSLNLLSLSHNNLSGSIPESISQLSKLKILKLEVNHLSGEIPQQLGALENLVIANVSYNRLVGRLPEGGIFPTIDASAIEGNLGVCSPMLKGPCMLNVPKPLVLDPYAYGDQEGGNEHHRPAERFRHHRFLSVSSVVAISAAAVIAIGVLVISLLSASARRRMAFVDNALESMCSSSTRSSNLSAGKLILFDSKSSAREWFDDSLDSVLNKAAEVGEGVFGTVYKASFGEQGPTLAIKKLITANTLQYQEEFDREVRVLAKARHPNLVALRGYYWTPQLQLLVSDYAVNGSLQSKLHELPSPNSPSLTWSERFKIVLGTAKGLAHLHHSFRPPIIHYNIKPSNILLDENMNPKISDFGLARLLTKLDRHVVSNRFQSAVGYVAPELACQNLRVNEKCDVHGFGVLILEVVTGRRPVEYGEDSVVILSDHVRVLLEQGNVLECVDSRMGKYLEEELLPVLKLALVCTSQIPSSRPSMAEVVQILHVINTPVPNRTEVF